MPQKQSVFEHFGVDSANAMAAKFGHSLPADLSEADKLAHIIQNVSGVAKRIEDLGLVNDLEPRSNPQEDVKGERQVHMAWNSLRGIVADLESITAALRSLVQE